MTGPTANHAEPTQPRTVDEFVEWAEREWGLDLSTTERWYRQNVAAALNAVQASDVFAALVAGISELSQEETGRTGHEFLMRGQSEVNLVTKPFESVLDKTLRVNVLQNTAFPNEPEGGWVHPDAWFARFDDLVRGQVICRFVDGPRKAAEHVASIANGHGVDANVVSRQHERGYYAHHAYIRIPVQLLARNGEDLDAELSVEVQFATQLQDIMYKITHRFYEAERIGRLEGGGEWKWHTSSARFRAAYISHTLHLLEANILELRDRFADRPDEEDTP